MPSCLNTFRQTLFYLFQFYVDHNFIFVFGNATQSPNHVVIFKHQHIIDAQKVQVDEGVFSFFAGKATANEVRHGIDLELVHDGSANGHRTRAFAGGDAPGRCLLPGAEPAAELKSLRYFRSTWSRLSLEQQLSRALAQAPDNAGPLNSHFLVLQALIRMRDIAPPYLEGFIAHVDALLWLERADAGRGMAPKAGARAGEARALGSANRRTHEAI